MRLPVNRRCNYPDVSRLMLGFSGLFHECVSASTFMVVTSATNFKPVTSATSFKPVTSAISFMVVTSATRFTTVFRRLVSSL